MKSGYASLFVAALIGFTGSMLMYQRWMESLETIDLMQHEIETLESRLEASRRAKTHGLRASQPMADPAVPPSVMMMEDQEPAGGSGEHESEENGTDPSEQYENRVVAMRLGSIGHFVELSDEQRERLREKFTNEVRRSGETTESLVDILGAEKAQFLQEQREAAYQNSTTEQFEREMYYWSRKLVLNLEQEQFFVNALQETEADLAEWRKGQGPPTSPRQGALWFLEEGQMRRKILRDRLKDVLSKEQYADFLKLEAQSSAADTELWHDMGTAPEEVVP